FSCQTPLTAEDQRDPRYVFEKSCPYCFRQTEDQIRDLIRTRHEAIQRVSTPLPGSRPYDNYRPLNVSAAYDGRTLIDFVCEIMGHSLSREDWLKTIDE